MNLLIVTACPNGMVTSVLTSRLLEAAAHRMGWSTAVEVHDPKAIGSPLTPAQIALAWLVRQPGVTAPWASGPSSPKSFTSCVACLR